MIVEKQKEIIANFNTLSWEDRYKKIIDMGKKLPPMKESLKIDKYKVKGCQSQVWIHAQLNEQGQVIYTGDSDAMIVRGLVSILLEVFSNAELTEILQAPTDFIKDLGFDTQLSPSRANGFMSMLKQIKLYAMAFQMIKKNKS